MSRCPSRPKRHDPETLDGNSVAMKKRLPDQFAWVKVSGEAGQDLPAIFCRKNFERKSDLGKHQNTFWWGIGESRVDAVRHLGSEPKVLFSEAPKAKPKDDGVRLWLKYRHGGESRKMEIPDHVIVTSKQTDRSWHCALVCRSCGAIEDSGKGFEGINENEFPNILKSGKMGEVGGHTTRVVRRMPVPGVGNSKLHQVVAFLDLVDPYCVILTDSRELTNKEFDRLKSVSRPGTKMKEWQQVVAEIRSAN